MGLERKSRRLQSEEWLDSDNQPRSCLSNRTMNAIPIIVFIIAYLWFNWHRIGNDPYWGAEISAILIVILPFLVCYYIYTAEQESKKTK